MIEKIWSDYAVFYAINLSMLSLNVDCIYSPYILSSYFLITELIVHSLYTN